MHSFGGGKNAPKMRIRCLRLFDNSRAACLRSALPAVSAAMLFLQERAHECRVSMVELAL